MLNTEKLYHIVVFREDLWGIKMLANGTSSGGIEAVLSVTQKVSFIVGTT